jgi:hypothetical protein
MSFSKMLSVRTPAEANFAQTAVPTCLYYNQLYHILRI